VDHREVIYRRSIDKLPRNFDPRGSKRALKTAFVCLLALIIALPADADASQRRRKKARPAPPPAAAVVEPPVGANRASPAIALSGSYALTRIGNRPVRGAELAATRLTFLPRFDVSGTTACNSFQAKLHTDTRASKIVGFDNIISTQMACPGKQGEAEVTTLRILRETANIARAGDTISLFAANGFLLAQFTTTEAAPTDAAQALPPEQNSASRSGAAPVRIANGDFVLSELGGVPVAVPAPPNVVPRPVVAPNTRFLTILPTLYLREGSTISGLSGCNQYTSSLVSSPDQTKALGPFQSTRKRCLDRPTERTERDFQTAFRNTRRVVTGPTNINLYDGAGVRLARFTSVTARGRAGPSLTGNVWVLRSLNGAAVRQPGGPSLVFEGNQVIGSTGCNRFNMIHNRRGGRSRFQDGAMTRMACTDRARSDLEQRFMSGLSTVTRLDLTQTGLTMRADDDGTIMVFEAE
jgi:heat shock protein HslJ